MNNFDRYIAIDWSGAMGPALKGLAVAEAAAGDGAPSIIPPPRQHRFWQRSDIADYLLALTHKQERILCGFDFSFSLPFDDQEGYFPGIENVPAEARGLWRLVDDICKDDDDFYAGRFVRHDEFSAWFRRPGIKGGRFTPALRVVEQACAAQGLGRAESVFNLIGPAQVGLGSLSGMRMLHHITRQTSQISVWPFDTPGHCPVLLVEIYTRLFLTEAGFPVRKIRSYEDLNSALATLGAATIGAHPFEGPDQIDDHVADALISAAGLRTMVQGQNGGVDGGENGGRYSDKNIGLWTPPSLTHTLAQREGWTFGVR